MDKIINTTDRPLVSIITVSYNAAATIEETILSVINQDYKNIEYIIIDGCSTDGTLDIIRKYEDKIAYWVSEKDYGLYHAMNKGIEYANGEIIGIINADDYYYAGAISNVIKTFKDKKLNQHIFFGDMQYGDILVPGWRPKAIKRSAFGTHPSMFVPREVYAAIGIYKLQYKILSDYDFMYRAFNIHKILPLYLNERIAFFRPGGLSSNNIFRAYTEEMLIKLENGEKFYKSFGLYLLKLLKFAGTQIIKRQQK
ncbi:glycosyltransferase family 2 protein [uncultured Sulfuricurvum sp.]|uniref:glycosyltransferase family 2 protein n=1 Tax=uncultured Sulfuricurvum sp. TaxID=430693 RepID=UPI002618BA2D|nr:glycosyltransferase family 2 protein [uncultured Sulfuricurvum sp.]